MAYDFPIRSAAPASSRFLEKGIGTFAAAAGFVRALPYGRNADKHDPLAVFAEEKGTCSTKHALLCRLARENGHDEVQLMLGLYRMNARNTPKAAAVLQENGLEYLPEAHSYLLINGVTLDCTGIATSADWFRPDLIQEISIDPEQIVDFKVDWHRQQLVRWLEAQPQVPYDLEALWQIREACIRALSV